jgi:hypothetical protein
VGDVFGPEGSGLVGGLDGSDERSVAAALEELTKAVSIGSPSMGASLVDGVEVAHHVGAKIEEVLALSVQLGALAGGMGESRRSRLAGGCVLWRPKRRAYQTSWRPTWIRTGTEYSKSVPAMPTSSGATIVAVGVEDHACGGSHDDRKPQRELIGGEDSAQLRRTLTAVALFTLYLLLSHLRQA